MRNILSDSNDFDISGYEYAKMIFFLNFTLSEYLVRGEEMRKTSKKMCLCMFVISDIYNVGHCKRKKKEKKVVSFKERCKATKTIIMDPPL